MEIRTIRKGTKVNYVTIPKKSNFKVGDVVAIQEVKIEVKNEN